MDVVRPFGGEPEQQRTSVWIGYDSEAIYFAFRCYDDEPAKIRSTISRRDNVWSDDWVGVSLDSSRAGQIAYHMFVNPAASRWMRSRVPTKTPHRTGSGRVPVRLTQRVTSSKSGCRFRASGFAVGMTCA